jgi:hypothetical protein
VKGYFYLLCVLFAASALVRILSLVVIEDALTGLRFVADIILFGLCLRGCFGLAFGRRYLSTQAWRLIGHLTLALGGVNVILRISGPDLGLAPQAGPADPFSLALSFLPYILFAIPAILYGHSLQHSTKE